MAAGGGRPHTVSGQAGTRAAAGRQRSGARAASAAAGGSRRGRGADTRERLIRAALDIFGQLGFEGATTRDIAARAGVNLAAIVYHFGSKEALHLAVAEHIARGIESRIGPALARAAEPEATATPAAARSALIQLFDAIVEMLLGEAEAERWARFVVREQMQPTAAFEVIYGRLGGAHALGTRLLAAILGRSEDEEEVRLLVFTLLGQILVFRVAQALVLRRTGWKAVGDRERAEVRRIVRRNIHAILDALGSAS